MELRLKKKKKLKLEEKWKLRLKENVCIRAYLNQELAFQSMQTAMLNYVSASSCAQFNIQSIH